MQLIKHCKDQFNVLEYIKPYLAEYNYNNAPADKLIVLHIGNYSKWYLNQ